MDKDRLRLLLTGLVKVSKKAAIMDMRWRWGTCLSPAGIRDKAKLDALNHAVDVIQDLILNEVNDG